MEAPYGRPAAFPPPNQAREYENQALPHMTDGQMDRSFQIATKLKNTNPIIYISAITESIKALKSPIKLLPRMPKNCLEQTFVRFLGPFWKKQCF